MARTVSGSNQGCWSRGGGSGQSWGAAGAEQGQGASRAGGGGVTAPSPPSSEEDLLEASRMVVGRGQARARVVLEVLPVGGRLARGDGRAAGKVTPAHGCQLSPASLRTYQVSHRLRLLRG